MKKVERALVLMLVVSIRKVEAYRLVLKTDVITTKTPPVIRGVEGITKRKDSPYQWIIDSEKSLVACTHINQRFSIHCNMV